jgi:hypothetical protein
MRYEVRTYTICDGWVNCWLLDDKPQTFDTEAAAWAEIEEHIADLALMAAEEGEEFDADGEGEQFRVEEVA